jgi:5-methylcytosine-specific restriction endonuclease McrA
MPRGWAHTRLRILDRDAWACRNCGAPACEVHHMIQGVETDANLIALCHACHQEITQQQARAGHV